MAGRFIDINVDVGEGIGNEPIIMPFISSCNIACGGHAGDSESMRRVVKLAKENDVKIGAHPSFPDKANFGRKKIMASLATGAAKLTFLILGLWSKMYPICIRVPTMYPPIGYLWYLLST